MDRRWVLQPATNPSVLRVHVAHELTDRTIVTSPPAEVAMPIAGLLELEAVRTLDLHRYVVRMNLAHGADRDATAAHARQILGPAWGAEAAIGEDPEPRAFEAAHRVERLVAESAEMAAGDETLEALFRVDGVTEVVAGDGVVLVRLGALFAWRESEATVAAALAAQTKSSREGMP